LFYSICLDQIRIASLSNPRETILKDLNLLLDDLHREWGFCNQRSAASLLESHSAIGAADFAAAVL
jgi:hypothetical protein